MGNKNSFFLLRNAIHEKIVYGKMLNNIKTNGLSKYMSFERVDLGNKNTLNLR